MSSKLTDEYIKGYIEEQFGVPVLEFEAHERLYSNAKTYALSVINDFKPKVKKASYPNVATGGGSVAFIDMPGIQGISYVEFVDPYSTAVSSSLLDNIFALQFAIYRAGWAPGFSVKDLMVVRDWINNLEIVNASKADWYWSEEHERLILFVPKGPMNVWVEYFVDQESPLEIRKEDDLLFLDIASARMKILIGRIRSKYGNALPSPGGTPLNMDGETLLAEGKEELDKIKEKLDHLKLDVGLLYG